MSVNRSSAAQSNERLAARRQRGRRRAHVAFGILFVFLCAGAVDVLRQSGLRISEVRVYGADASFAAIATDAMRGNYLGLIPRDSTFFFPASRIRADIIAGHPDIAAVSIFRDGLTGLSIKVNDRVPIARWCGAYDAPFKDCYVFDASGFVYAATTSVQLVNSFVVYEPTASSTVPLGSTLPNAARLPAAFDFARQLGTFGSPVASVVFRDDEVDDYLASGTRVTYVLGDEQSAFTALVSGRADMNLADGSLAYVDLRFDGKIYLKKKK